jgi:hypothetical protein
VKSMAYRTLELNRGKLVYDSGAPGPEDELGLSPAEQFRAQGRTAAPERVPAQEPEPRR